MRESPKSLRQLVLERVLACQETLLRNGRNLGARQNVIYTMSLLDRMRYATEPKEVQAVLIQVCATALTAIEGLELET